jgi:hypothetical protein
MTIRHSKYKNTGLIFELLMKKLTSDLMIGVDSASINIIKKYFTNTELSKELKIYEIFLKNRNVSESKANTILDLVNVTYKKLNHKLLKTEKYNLIKEIKNHYNLEEFFKPRVKDYKELASLYILLEINKSKEFINPKETLKYKSTLFEYLTNNKINPIIPPINEFEKEDKSIRTISFYVLLEKFNSKYSNLHPDQKFIIKEFINNVDNSEELKNIYNNKILEIKNKLKKHIKIIKEPHIKIKLKEIYSLIKEIQSKTLIKNNNLVDILQYYSLLNELESTHGEI